MKDSLEITKSILTTLALALVLMTGVDLLIEGLAPNNMAIYQSLGLVMQHPFTD